MLTSDNFNWRAKEAKLTTENYFVDFVDFEEKRDFDTKVTSNKTKHVQVKNINHCKKGLPPISLLLGKKNVFYRWWWLSEVFRFYSNA